MAAGLLCLLLATRALQDTCRLPHTTAWSWGQVDGARPTAAKRASGQLQALKTLRAARYLAQVEQTKLQTPAWGRRAPGGCSALPALQQPGWARC